MSATELHEFEIGGVKYVASKLDAMKQFHVVRRLAPALTALMPAAGFKALKNELEKSMTEALPKFAEMLAGIKDEDAEFVIYGLLSCVKKREEGGLGYAAIVVGNRLQYQDMSMPDMMKIAFKAGQINFRDFLDALPQTSSGANQTQKSQ